MTDTAAAATGSREAALGDLPEWRLEDLYAGPDDPALEADLTAAEQAARDFKDAYAGQLAGLSGDALATAVAGYERIDESLSRVLSFAYLVYAQDMANPENGRFLQGMQERATTISKDLVFFTLELNRLDQPTLDRGLTAPALARYQPWLRDLRAFRPHQLSDELEQYVHEKHVTGRQSWVRLFDETIAALRFPINGQPMGASDALNCLSDRNAATRKDAAQSIGTVLGDNVRLFAHITNTLAKDKQVDDGWRRYAQPWSSRNLSNQVEDAVVDALVSAVRSAYPRLSHRYYALKARWFGGAQLDYWDRNAPLPDDQDRSIPWADARSIVLDTYAQFAPGMAAVAERFFDGGWIDAPVRAGKAPGAFAHPTVPSAHPYVLVNYHGKARDVMTLAHELGHGVHQVLAADQGHLMADTPLTLAETASVFGEMLTFRSLLDRETDPKKRRALLASKVEDMLNTVIRQIAFFEFERRVHTERKDGELSVDRINEIWMTVQTESLGPALRFDDQYRVFWAYIPHFVHSPFYVYAYAFGDCLVNSLYALYAKADAGFADRYLDMLRAGGTKRHQDLLAPFGLDASAPEFWDHGLAMIGDLLDELEATDRAIG